MVLIKLLTENSSILKEILEKWSSFQKIKKSFNNDKDGNCAYVEYQGLAWERFHATFRKITLKMEMGIRIQSIHDGICIPRRDIKNKLKYKDLRDVKIHVNDIKSFKENTNIDHQSKIYRW